MEEEILIPYNVNNILITENDIKKLFQKYDITINVKNISFYREALTHKSYVESEYTKSNLILKKIKSTLPPTVVDLMPKSSERLEYYGDTVVKTIVAGYLFRRYTKENEGFLTKIKTKIENKKSLAHFARLLGINNFLLISKQNEELKNRDSDRFLEDAFEAFMGALKFDQGFEFCEIYLNKLLETEIDYSEILYIDTNFKDKLQRFYHQNSWGHPEFEDISSEIVNGKRMFTVAVKDVKGNEIVRAQESKKQKAEQKVSMLALLKFGQLYPDQIVSEFDG